MSSGTSGYSILDLGDAVKATSTASTSLVTPRLPATAAVAARRPAPGRTRSRAQAGPQRSRRAVCAHQTP
eukprot:3089976-Pyramimonas_sp.AAC.1